MTGLKKSRVFLVLTVVMVLVCAVFLSSCKKSPDKVLQQAIDKTTETLKSEFDQMVSKNNVLKALSDMQNSGARFTLALPEALVNDALGLPMPLQFVLSADPAGAASLTTTLAGREIGFYYTQTGMALDLLKNPIKLEYATGYDDLNAFLANNGLPSLDEMFEGGLFPQYGPNQTLIMMLLGNGMMGITDISEIFSLFDLNSAYYQEQKALAENLEKALKKVDFLGKFIKAATIKELPSADVALQTKTVKADVLRVSITEKDFVDWAKASLKALKNEKTFKDFFKYMYESGLGELLGMSQYYADAAYEMFFAKLEEELDYANWKELEKFYADVYISGGKVIKTEISYNEEMLLSFGFLGDKNLTDKIEIATYALDGGEPVMQIIMEGNLIPVNNKVAYTIKYSDYYSSQEVSIDWDLSKTSGSINNFVIKTVYDYSWGSSYEDTVSFFFGMPEKGVVGLNFDVDMYWETARIKLSAEPLTKKITLPANSINIKDYDLSQLDNDLRWLMEFLFGF